MHSSPAKRHPWLAAFFAFGATMCALTIFLLSVPGTSLDILWRANPEARAGFQSIGPIAILFMLTVGAACAAAAIGLWRGTVWGVAMSVAILSLNMVGDSLNAVLRHDLRALIGLPIAGAMIWFLLRLGLRPMPSRDPCNRKQ